MNIKRINFLLLLLFGTAPIFLSAQSQTIIENALRFVEEQSSDWGLSNEDISNLLVSDLYKTQHNGVTHIYFKQAFNSIPIYNGVTGVHITRDGEAKALGHRFVAGLSERVSSSLATITPEEAVRAAAQRVGVTDPIIKSIEAITESETGFVFESSNISQSDIALSQCYVLDRSGDLRLAWDLAIDDIHSPDYLSIRVDAATGMIIDETNWTTYCRFDHDHISNCGATNQVKADHFLPVDEAISALSSGSYRVFPLPAESPNHGSHDLIDNPHISEASPFGWHDVSGDGTSDYTITRGNNVHAYPDLNDDDQSTGGEPDGGASLLFDFPYDKDAAPIDQLEAAIVNVFYMSNMMHDISYLFGFDEAAGNFQANNHGNGGAGDDYVLAEGQDGSGTNNANFSTPPDGGNGRMQMFVWTSGGEVFTVLEPQAVAKGYESAEASFGPNIAANNINIEAEIVEAFDNDPDNPSYCCNPIINGEDLDGKIALIDRGGCFFDYKVRNAEDNGAIAVIICNFAPTTQGMGPSGTVTEPTIPSISIGSTDCAQIRAFAGRGLIGRIKAAATNLVALDGDYDNGIIAHEYGHGISNRLTGGPQAAGCLGNAEQMGEGWSDFFSLITTAKPGDSGETARGIGTYALRQPVEGGGIRPRPYSTDFSINELTYKHVADGAQISQPHGIGTVWCTMLWDLYWALSDEYGFDPDFMNSSAGNNIAIQLVMDGMKLQRCNPGFVDGRDAILLADELNNDGANYCLIWEVFARRGLGYYADQGSSGDRFDGVENFETAPLCQNRLRISKEAPNLVKPGEEFEYKIVVANNKTESTNGVIVTDILADGCSYVDGSANVTPTITGDELVFDLGDMASLEQREITYTVKASESRASRTIWYDDLEDGEDNWDVDLREGFTIWYLQDEMANSGDWAFFTENQDDDSDQLLFQFDPITLDVANPGMRFYHWYNTYTGDNVDGGVVQISPDGVSWKFIQPEEMLRNGYDAPLPYGTFTIPNLSGFAGSSGQFIDSYIDLGNYKDEDVQIRFRFGTEEGGADGSIGPLTGWMVDDVEYLDLFFYKTDACLTSDSGDDECASLPGKGTLVEPKLGVSANDLPTSVENVVLYPSPATDRVNVMMEINDPTTATMSIIAEDGKVVRTIDTNLRSGMQIITLEVNDLPVGAYFLDVSTKEGRFSKTFLKK